MNADAAPYGLRHGLASAGASIVAGVTQSLGWQLVNSNLSSIQGSLNASLVEATWLSTAYFAVFVPAVLLVTKVRLEYGMRFFANIGITCFIAVSVLHLLTESLASAIAVRAAHGIAAVPLSTMAVLYMIQAFPARLAIVGIVLGFGTLQLGTPLARMVATGLLEIGQWHGLYLIDVALPLLCLAVVNAVKVAPQPTEHTFSRGDLVSFPLWAVGIGLLVVFFSQGRLHWWRDADWLGVCLAGAIACLGLLAVVELHRKRPLLNVRWLVSPYMLQFVAAIVLFRLVVSEQTVGAVGLLNVLGLNNDQMHGLFALVLAGTVAGLFVALAIAKRWTATGVGIAAAVLIAVAAWMDSDATALTRVPELYFTQTLLALGSAMLFAASVIAGFARVIADGRKDLLSFVAIFPAAQFLGSLFGAAWIGTFVDDHQRRNVAALAEHLSLADAQVAARVSQLGASLGGVVTDPSQRGAQGVAMFAQQASREAYVLAYNEMFQAIAAIAVGMLIWFMVNALRARRTQPQAQPA